MHTEKLDIHDKSLAQNKPSLQKINNLGDAIWFGKELKIIDERTGAPREYKVYFSDLSKSQRHWAQTLILDAYPYTDPLGSLAYTQTTINAIQHSCFVIIKYLNQQPGKMRTLRHWSRNDVATFLNFAAFRPDGSLYSCGRMRKMFATLSRSYKLRYQIDGIQFLLDDLTFIKTMQTICKSAGIKFEEWSKYRNRELMPCSVATLLMADAIRTIRSNETKILMAYFDTNRECLINSLFERIKRAPVLDDFMKLNVDADSKRKLSSPIRSAWEQRVRFVQKLRNIDPSLDKFPIATQKQLSELVEHTLGACITILLAVTAMRMSELHGLRANQTDYAEVFDPSTGRWEVAEAVIYSRIIKTGGGLIAKRGLSPIGVEVFNLINALSWVDKCTHNLLLFEPSYKYPQKYRSGRWEKRGISGAWLRIFFKNYYRSFISRVDESIKASYPHAVPHDLRHFKAAFALRKFDGAVHEVEEAIRIEFRHYHYQTQTYTQNKLNEQERAFVRADFMKEFVHRMLVNDPNDRWIGPGVNKLREAAIRILDEQSIELLTITEFAEFFESLDEEIHALTLHSYGACIVLKENIRIANCGTRDNIVLTGDAHSELCYGCGNFGLGKVCHQHELTLNQRRWQQVADDPLLNRFKLNGSAATIAKRLAKFELELRDTQ